jgi:hypothetical protein
MLSPCAPSWSDASCAPCAPCGDAFMEETDGITLAEGLAALDSIELSELCTPHDSDTLSTTESEPSSIEAMEDQEGVMHREACANSRDIFVFMKPSVTSHPPDSRHPEKCPGCILFNPKAGEEFWVTNLKGFTVVVVVRDVMTNKLSTEPIDLYASLVFDGDEREVPPAKQKSALVRVVHMGARKEPIQDTRFTVENGHATLEFRVADHALSYHFDNCSFRVKIAPVDAKLRESQPQLQASVGPFKSKTKMRREPDKRKRHGSPLPRRKRHGSPTSTPSETDDPFDEGINGWPGESWAFDLPQE